MKKKILDWLFYNYDVRTLEEVFDITIILLEKNEEIFRTKMKHIPQKGSHIIINSAFDKFLIQEVSIFKNGYVARLEGKMV